MAKRVKFLKGLQDKEERVYIEGDCFCHVLAMEDWFDSPTEKDPKINFWQLQMAFYNHGVGYNDNSMTFKNKLRCIWDIVRGRGPWLDSLLLDRDKAKKFAFRLMEKIERADRLMKEYNESHG